MTADSAPAVPVRGRQQEAAAVEARRRFDARVLRFLAANGNTDPLTAGEVAAAMRENRERVRRSLERSAQAGRIDVYRHGQATYYQPKDNQ